MIHLLYVMSIFRCTQQGERKAPGHMSEVGYRLEWKPQLMYSTYDCRKRWK
jgi:hypothetical protein